MQLPLAPYAALAISSKGRCYEEPYNASPFARSPYQRDRDRIIHSTAFRRLGHKTQVFVSPRGDHIRTRLTHSLEVAQIARSLARALQVDEDLTEAIALSHDLGHPPFGHAGEERLAELMAPHGGFDHNQQTLKIVTQLEQRYPNFAGLNLTLECLEGIIKHNGPCNEATKQGFKHIIGEVAIDFDHFASLEAQIAGLADDIAYNHHDLDDGLKAGLFHIEQLLEAVPHVAQKYMEMNENHTFRDIHLAINSLVRGLIGDVMDDVLDVSLQNLKNLGALDALNCDAICHANHAMIATSKAIESQQKQLKQFLKTHMYQHESVSASCREGQGVIEGLFHYYLDNPDKLPEQWLVDQSKPTPRLICDYIAGMTDRYAQTVFSETSQ